MRVGKVRTVREVEGFWQATIAPGAVEVSAGQLVEQVRGSESVLVWEVVGEKGPTLVLAPTTMNAPDGFPVPTSNTPDLKPGDDLDLCVGGRYTHLGLGDVIAKATKALGFEPCAGCEERRQKLNRLFPNVMKR